jgi:adenylylsulfate kinase
VLESDTLRPILSPHPTYTDDGRDIFYRQLVSLGALLTRQGVPVIFDATANRRRYREHARAEISAYLEVYVECPLEICMARDPKDIYRSAQEGMATTVPGLQSAYEPPEAPDVMVRGDKELPESAAQRIVGKLRERRLLGM